jgi:hypothetical protein
MIAPYLISANNSFAFKTSLANGVASERPAKGIMPRPPSQAAAEGTLEASDMAVSFELNMPARSSIKYRIETTDAPDHRLLSAR